MRTAAPGKDRRTDPRLPVLRLAAQPSPAVRLFRPPADNLPHRSGRACPLCSRECYGYPDGIQVCVRCGWEGKCPEAGPPE
jgi:hypothetical protein